MKRLLTVLFVSAALAFTPTLVGCSDDERSEEPIEATEVESQEDEGVAEKRDEEKKAEEEAKKKAAEEKKKQEEEEAKKKAEEEANRPPHIVYSDVSISAIRDTRGTYSTVYVVLELRANCDKDSSFEDQVTVWYSVNGGKSYDMSFLPAEWDVSVDKGRSYSNALLRCNARFESAPGDQVSFWLEDSETGATYEGLDNLVDQLTVATVEAINTPIEDSGGSGYGDERTCYVTPTGYAYHSRTGCPRLSRSTEVYEMTVGDAKDEGYEPCDFCY